MSSATLTQTGPVPLRDRSLETLWPSLATTSIRSYSSFWKGNMVCHWRYHKVWRTECCLPSGQFLIQHLRLLLKVLEDLVGMADTDNNAAVESLLIDSSAAVSLSGSWQNHSKGMYLCFSIDEVMNCCVGSIRNAPGGSKSTTIRLCKPCFQHLDGRIIRKFSLEPCPQSNKSFVKLRYIVFRWNCIWAGTRKK